MALPLARRAHGDAHASALLDRDAGTFVWPDPRRFVVGRDTEADEPPLGSRRLLPLTKRLVAGPVQRGVEKVRIIARVVDRRASC